MKDSKKSLSKILLIITMIVCIGLPNGIFADNRYTHENDPYAKESKKYNYNYGDSLEINKSSDIYNSIYKSLINLEDSVDLSKYGTPKSSEVFDIRKKVLDDHPEIFYFTHENSFYWSNGKLEFKYIDSKESIKKMICELDKKVNHVLSTYISNSMSEIEKVIAIHDYLVLNTEYKISNDHDFDVYGVLVKGRGVCQGYTTSMKLLLNKVGIDSTYVASPAMNHIWNIVNIDGENYQLDATWDDPVPNREGVVRYSYLALSDSEMGKDHTWDKSSVPKCDSDKYKYMREMDYVVNDKEYRYYTNVSDGHKIYKIKKDGSCKEKILNSPGTPLYIKDRYLYYKDLYNGNTKNILIKNSDSIENQDNTTNHDKIEDKDNTIKHDTIVFNDVYNHWAKNTINLFVRDGYINGYGDNTFRPDNSITRAEFVKILNKYFGLKKGSGKVFNDTKKHWAKDEIDIAVTNGVCQGVSKEEFMPDEPITREQASVMISNFRKIADTNNDKMKKFSDYKDISVWAISSVEGILESGYMNGYPDNTFKPKSNMTRAEALVTLSRIK